MILGIVASQRKNSNSEFIAKKILEGVESEIVLLYDLDIERYNGEKEYGDDVPGLVEKIKGADGILFAAPSYFSNVPGILKDFIDRTNPQYTSREFEGKKAAIAAVGGGPEKSVRKAIGAISEYCRIQGIEVVGSLALRTHDREPEEHPKEFMEKVDGFRNSLKGKLF